MAKEEGEEVSAEPSSDSVNASQTVGKKRTIAVSRNGKSGSDEKAETKKPKTESDGSKDVVTNDTIQALADELGLADEEEIHPPSPPKKAVATSAAELKRDSAGSDGKPMALSSQAGLRRTDGIRGRLEGVGGRTDGVRGRGANVFAAVVAETTRAEPPQQDLTAVLRMEGLRRPFTEKQLRELLAETGEVTWFWINRIKSLAYAEFGSESEADATRRALYDLQVPAPRAARSSHAAQSRALPLRTARTSPCVPRALHPQPRPQPCRAFLSPAALRLGKRALCPRRPATLHPHTARRLRTAPVSAAAGR